LHALIASRLMLASPLLAGWPLPLRNGAETGSLSLRLTELRSEASALGLPLTPLSRRPGYEPFHLVITHLSGYAWLKFPDQVIPATIELTAWARIEGVLRVGSQPSKM